jgi:hypothetical protein
LFWRELAARLDVDPYAIDVPFTSWPLNITPPAEGSLDREQFVFLLDHLAEASRDGNLTVCTAYRAPLASWGRRSAPATMTPDDNPAGEQLGRPTLIRVGTRTDPGQGDESQLTATPTRVHEFKGVDFVNDAPVPARGGQKPSHGGSVSRWPTR